MTSGTAESTSGAIVPRRDWVLLPLLALLTIVVLVASLYIAARLTFHGEAPFACLTPGKGWDGDAAPPNSSCRDKAFEGPWIDYHFNSCGHRTKLACRQKADGAYRIVLAGSSVVMGHRVEEDKTFASLLPAELSERTGRTVEVYNEGLVTMHPHQVALRFHEVLAAQPDLLLWVVSPTDVERVLPPEVVPGLPQGSGLFAKARFRMQLDAQGKSLKGALSDLWGRGLQKFDQSAPGTLLEHALYRSQGQYIKSILAGGDEQGFLKRQLDAKWQLRLQYFRVDFLSIQSQAAAAHVPVVVAFLPSRGEAALISLGHWPADDDPYALGNDLRTIVTGNGGMYLDVLRNYQKIPRSEELYFPVDGHPTEAGQASIAAMLTQALTAGPVPALKAQ